MEAKAVKKLAVGNGLSIGELIHKWVAEKIARSKKPKRSKR